MTLMLNISFENAENYTLEQLQALVAEDVKAVYEKAKQELAKVERGEIPANAIPIAIHQSAGGCPCFKCVRRRAAEKARMN